MIIFALPLLIAVAGGIAGFFAFSSYLRLIRRGKSSVLLLLIVLASMTAAIPYMGEQLYNIGMSSSASIILEGVSYFAFSFATVGAWMFLAPSRKCLLLLVLIPISFAKPFILAATMINWSIYGYHP